jgi:hypothetical protein
MAKDLCFVIMPFSTPSGSGHPLDHFTEVYEDLFVPAVQAAGFDPRRADTTVLSRHILGDLLSAIETASIVLCDLSGANPNVLFELGWAFRADKPCVLVKDDTTEYPFDLQHSHVQSYHGSLKARLVKEGIQQLAQLIQNTANDKERRWSLVQSLGLDARLRSQAAGERDPIAAAILDIREELGHLRAKIEYFGLPNIGPKADRSGTDAASVTLSPNQQSQRDEILAVLEDERGNVGRAAQVLGLSKNRLYKLIHVLNIPLDEARR